MSRGDVLRLRDRFADKPGKANNWLNVLRRLLAFAVDRRMRRENPAAHISPLPIGEREPWPAEVLERALAAASPMARLAIITGLCSGARIGDVIRMQHGWHDGSLMQFVASKNKVDVAVPMHPLWLEELAKVPRRSVTLLYDRSGKPVASTKALQERVRDLLKSLAVTGYSFHGLRKNAACYLAELGLSDGEIGDRRHEPADGAALHQEETDSDDRSRCGRAREAGGRAAAKGGTRRRRREINAEVSTW